MNRAVRLTNEQQAIISSTGDIRINAVAGSGKTTTLIEYAASRPPGARILYLAFNKSVKLEAQRKFSDRGLRNVKVETAHSLAYRHIFRQNNYTLKPNGYQTHEIVDLLSLRGYGEKLTEYIVANHINKFITYFCNSDKQKVQELRYTDTLSDPKVISFVQSFYPHIEAGARLLLGKMDKGQADITHDFYLKKFQLSGPTLDYDYILFDEGQDASAAMLSVFLAQKAVKVIVGDTHQQIYGWRHAVNSLEKTDFTTYHLSTSFRFGQPIADLAAGLLQWKKHLNKYSPVTITGKGTATVEKSRATIARTNLGLLLHAIHFITDNPGTRYLYFEGNINSYTYADEGASLYDVLHLYNSRHHLIRDKLIKSMQNLADLEEYIDKTEDVQLSMMVEIVREYGNDIPGLIKQLKELHTGDDHRDKAAMIFSTVHRAKGMEYDVVHLADDFITEADLEQPKVTEPGAARDIPRLVEEINLLYVAVTRTKNLLHIPEFLLPKEFPAAPPITVLKAPNHSAARHNSIPGENEKPGRRNPRARKTATPRLDNAHTIAQRKTARHGNRKQWTPEADATLRRLLESGYSLSAIAKELDRPKGVIIARVRKWNNPDD